MKSHSVGLLALLAIAPACAARYSEPPLVLQALSDRPEDALEPDDAEPATEDPMAKPPAPGVTPNAPFPPIDRGGDNGLDNGLELRLLPEKALPVVELRLVVRSGSATDATLPGLASITGDLLKDGGTGAWSSRELVERIEALGAQLAVLTDQDSTRLSLSVTSDHFDEAIDLLGRVARAPRFLPLEFDKLKRRETERVKSLAVQSGTWAASMVLARELYELPAARHPYSHWDALPGEIARIGLADCRRWHALHFTPKNSFLVIAGDVAPDAAAAAAKRAFGAWKGEAPTPPTFADPMPPSGLELYLIDRPKSPQADVFVATLGPERRSDSWPGLRAATQILGGGVAGRLFLDVREKRSLAYGTGARVDSPAHGPAPIVLYAGTATPKAGLALAGLLEHFQKIGESAPSAEETSIATRYLSDIFLLRMETTGALADMAAELGVLGLPDGWFDEYRARVTDLAPPDVQEVAAANFRAGNALVVVAGDAERLARPLSHFAEVHVLAAEKGFSIAKSVPHDPAAPIELERKAAE